MGKQGVLCCGPDRKPRHFPAPPARIVDVTGAGDAFSSGVVAGLAREPQDLARACQIGHRLAAVTLECLSSVAPSFKPVFLQDCEKAFPPTHPKAGSHE